MFFINTAYNSKERYDLAFFMPYETDNYDVLNSYFLENFKKLPVKSTYKIITDEYQPDLIAKNVYNDEFLCDLLMLYNNIIDLNQLQSGSLINCFSLPDLESLFYSLKTNQQIQARQ